MKKNKFRYVVLGVSLGALLLLVVIGVVAVVHLKNGLDSAGLNHTALYEVISLIILTLVVYIVVCTLFVASSFKREIKYTKITNEMVSVASIYESMHKISMKNGTIQEYYAQDYIKPLFQRPFPRIREVLYYVIKQIAIESDLEMMKSFMDFDNLAARLLAQKVIYQEFQTKKSGWCKAMFIRVDGKDATEEVIFAIETINEEKEKENKLKYLSETDLMTSLMNRGSGEKAIRDALGRKEKGALLLLDIDKFKRYNDTYGHSAGDDVIISVAKALKGVFSSNDIVMRLGGDEFAVYLKDSVTENEVKEKIYVLFTEISNINLISINNTKINISLGVSIYDGSSYKYFEALYHEADECTYKSKQVEGNSYNFYKAN